jgi:hypothetical protein
MKSTARRSLLIGILIFAGQACGLSQNRLALEVGVRGGLPFTSTMKSELTGLAGTLWSQAYDRSPFSVGPTVTALLYDRVAVELSSLYKPVRGRGSGSSLTFPATSSTHGASWEFPLVADYRFATAPIGIYLGGGLVIGQFTTGTTETRTTSTQTGATTVQSSEFRGFSSQLPAFVVNGGLEWRSGRVAIRPELRYTHWSAVSQSTIAARHTNQFEYQIGFSFRGYKH